MATSKQVHTVRAVSEKALSMLLTKATHGAKIRQWWHDQRASGLIVHVADKAGGSLLFEKIDVVGQVTMPIARETEWRRFCRHHVNYLIKSGVRHSLSNQMLRTQPGAALTVGDEKDPVHVALMGVPHPYPELLILLAATAAGLLNESKFRVLFTPGPGYEDIDLDDFS